MNWFAFEKLFQYALQTNNENTFINHASDDTIKENHSGFRVTPFLIEILKVPTARKTQFTQNPRITPFFPSLPPRNRIWHSINFETALLWSKTHLDFSLTAQLFLNPKPHCLLTVDCKQSLSAQSGRHRSASSCKTSRSMLAHAIKLKVSGATSGRTQIQDLRCVHHVSHAAA